MPADLEHFKQLEVSCRRTLGETGGVHPDTCPKLRLHGVDFAIPRRGCSVVPTFGPDGVTVTTDGEDDWSGADKIVELVPIREGDTCSKCGQAVDASIEVDLQANAEFLTACFVLAGELLDRHYKLAAEQKSELLGFASDELPEWIPQLLRWAQGMSTEAPASDPLLAMAMAEDAAAPDTDTPDGP